MSILDTVLLFALPASGKSELRTYLASVPPDKCREDFHLGPTLQLDDYPYVHLMHRVDEELHARGWRRYYYRGPERPFQDDWEWAVLTELLNEDYDDLLARRTAEPASAAMHLFERFDRAHEKVGLDAVLGEVPYRILKSVAAALEPECRRELDVLNRTVSQDREGHTIVIEAARGGPNGAAFPLTPPLGYEATFQQLSEPILARASVLYVAVEPAESRRKNIERGRPDGQGSILHHSVPMEVMLGQYGCDDMEHLIRGSDQADTIRVERIFRDEPASGTAGGLAGSGSRRPSYRARTFHVPVAKFDNRVDKTSFLRARPADWRPDDVARVHDELRRGFSTLARLRAGAA
jgi:hypothetical protein